MKKELLALSTAALLMSCGGEAPESTDAPVDTTQTEVSTDVPEEDPQTGSFGATITPDGAITPAELMAQMEEQETMNTKLQATINECCKKKGCWMDVDMGNGMAMKVTFKDYGFFVPKNADGNLAIMEGVAYWDTISVDMLRHYEEDGLATDLDSLAREAAIKEIHERITEPELQLAFEATGVMIEENK